MSKVEAALLILKRTGKKMTYNEIVNIALEENLFTTIGKTPEATLRVDIYKENQRRTKSGRELRFNITDEPGFVALY